MATFKIQNTPVFAVTIALLMTLFSTSSLAESTDLPSRIMSMGQVQQSITYEGSLIYTRGKDVASYRIHHTNVNGEELLRMRRLENGQSDIVQKGDTFYCIHKKNKEMSIAEFSDARPQTLSLKPDLIARGIRHYDIEQQGEGTVAGRKCVWVSLMPMNGDRLNHRFCLDNKYDFALSSEIFTKQKEFLEKMSYIDIRFANKIDPVIFEMKAGADEELIRKNITSQDLNKAIPVALNFLPEGFEQISSKSRKHPTGRMIDTYLYSDGFSSFTIFIEDANILQKALKTFDSLKIRRMGSTTMISRPLGQKKISVVGEMPAQTLKRIITEAQK